MTRMLYKVPGGICRLQAEGTVTQLQLNAPRKHTQVTEKRPV